MKASKGDLKMMVESEGFGIKEVEWGDMHFSWERYDKPFDTTPFMKGLPDDRCQCPHYGYALKGGFTVKYKDREETIKEGDIYYLAPGHLLKTEPGTELLEWSPKDEFRKTAEAIERNMKAA